MTGQKSPATFFVFHFDLKAEKNDVAAVGKGWMRSDVPLNSIAKMYAATDLGYFFTRVRCTVW